MVDQILIDEIIKNPINKLNTLTTKQIVEILEQADEAFFNTNKTLFTDDMYDIIKGYLKKKDPKNPYLKRVGAEITFNKEKLPYYLGSLDKIKDNETEILKWKNKYQGEYVISEKLDGISCLLQYNEGVIKMWTRGDGHEGQNISHMFPYLRLNTSKFTEKFAVRGELIISKDNWSKMTHIGANARNVVAGAIHSKTINQEIVSKIDFVAYDLMYPRMKISDAFDTIKKLGIPLVKHQKIFSNDLNLDTLSNTLQEWRKQSAYEIDGIVIYHNELHKIMSGKNPKYAFAFKTILTHEQAEVIVTDVEWNISKHRYLKPIVKFNEVSLAGVKIRQATGFNGAYIQKNNIGPGSRLVIVRSGDVIPHILTVLTSSANGKPKMPDVPYIWTDTNVDILLATDQKNREQDIQAFTHFMKTLGIDGVKEGVITKIYDTGFDTLSKIINISLDDLIKIEGFKDKSSSKIIESLQNLKSVSCDKLMTASNIFGRGFGEKKIQLILDEYPNLISNKEKTLKLNINDLTKIKGIAETTAKQFIENLPKFFEFYEELNIKCIKTTLSPQISPKNTKLQVFRDKKIVFTGFRNKDYETLITAAGGKIVTAISKSTNYLIVKDNNDTSSKVEKAKEYGITIITKEDLEKMF